MVLSGQVLALDTVRPPVSPELVASLQKGYKIDKEHLMVSMEECVLVIQFGRP